MCLKMPVKHGILTVKEESEAGGQNRIGVGGNLLGQSALITHH